MRSENPICAPPHLSQVSPILPFKQVQNRLMDDGPLSSFQGRSSSASSFHASLFQVIGGVMYLALCSQVLSQVPQHFRSSEGNHLEINAEAGWQRRRRVLNYSHEIQTRKSLNERSFILTRTYSTQKCSGKSPLSSQKTTLKQQING